MYAKAVAQFKDAAADLSKTISEDADIMEIVQNNGWDDYSGPYTRSYNQHCLSGTLANLMTNLEEFLFKNNALILQQVT